MGFRCLWALAEVLVVVAWPFSRIAAAGDVLLSAVVVTADALPDSDQVPEDRTAAVTVISVDDQTQQLDERLLLNGQVLYDRLSHGFRYDGVVGVPSEAPDDGGFWSYKVGLAVDVAQGLRLQANAGRYNRFPTFSEMCGPQAWVGGRGVVEGSGIRNR